MASAVFGVTVMLCSWRPCIDMEFPPQETVSTSTADTARKRITADNLRIHTSNENPRKGKKQRKDEGSPPNMLLLRRGEGKLIYTTYGQAPQAPKCRTRRDLLLAPGLGAALGLDAPGQK